MQFLSIKKTLSDFAAKSIDLDRMITKGNKRYILAYHRILPKEIAQREHIHRTMWTTPETFANQIQWMQQIGEIVDIDRILDFNKGNTRPLFSITFDDGWKDNYLYAFPILKRFKVDAIIFLSTLAVETGCLFWPDEVLKKTFIAIEEGRESRVREYLKDISKKEIPSSKLIEVLDDFIEQLKELSAAQRTIYITDYYTRIEADPKAIKGFILSWDEVLEMSRCGIRFGSHTHTHAILKYCDSEEILRELITSKHIIMDRLNKEIDLFSYPNARYKKSNAFLLEQAGYKIGFRLHNFPVYKNDLPYFVPRMLVSEVNCENLNYFKMKLLGVPKYL